MYLKVATLEADMNDTGQFSSHLTQNTMCIYYIFNSVNDV